MFPIVRQLMALQQYENLHCMYTSVMREDTRNSIENSDGSLQSKLVVDVLNNFRIFPILTVT